MTVVLTVDGARWRERVAAEVAARPGAIAVVKGNGYGFGRGPLAAEALAAGAGALAVGTVDELDIIDSLAGAGRHRSDAADLTVAVLTPVADDDDARVLVERAAQGAPAGVAVVATVASPSHLAVLERAGWRGRVAIKVESSMHRYGLAPAAAGQLASRLADAGCTLDSFTIHLPLAAAATADGNDGAATADGNDGATIADGSDGAAIPGDREAAGDAANLAEADGLVAALAAGARVSVSHLSAASVATLAARHPTRTVVARAGTALWLGERGEPGERDASPPLVHLGATVVDVRPCRAGQHAGYRRTTLASDGTVVMIGAGTAHGVQPLADGRSPFHHARRRLALVEPPHMHTSMVIVPAGDRCPAIGDLVDLQRPLTQTLVDRVRGLTPPSNAGAGSSAW